ncbi:glycosyltransferase family 4 protein [Negadavirga shengliensis]|uniref:Glycosyltransferase family 4 protein n=1 Tax=Negadavirga shengliensis TaxID=1389218 RepID=A0ABV9T286_9BACT
MARKVLIYTNHFYPENFKVNEVASWLAGEGREVLVITGIPNYPSGNFHEGYGLFKNNKAKYGKVDVIRLPLVSRGSGSKIRLIVNYLTYFISTLIYTIFLSFFKKKFDTIIVHHTSPILIAIPPIIYRFFKRPNMILWDLDMWPDTLKAMGIIKSAKALDLVEIVVRWIYNKYDHILVGSKSFIIKANERTIPDKIQYFPNWAENAFQDQNILVPTHKYSFPSGFNIMYAGNIGEAQDFTNVFRAILKLKEEDINWLFVGDGRSKKWFQTKIEDSGLDSKVFFYGSHDVKYMPYFFDKASALFFSLKDEKIFSMTVPAKLQAYMASGKPIVGMISGEGAEIINNAKCGYAVKNGDFKSLANTILNLSRLDKDHRDIMGQNAKSFYEANFSSTVRKNEILRLVK